MEWAQTQWEDCMKEAGRWGQRRGQRTRAENWKQYVLKVDIFLVFISREMKTKCEGKRIYCFWFYCKKWLKKMRFIYWEANSEPSLIHIYAQIRSSVISRSCCVLFQVLNILSVSVIKFLKFQSNLGNTIDH